MKIKDENIKHFKDNLIKSEYNLVLDNLVNDMEIKMFQLVFVQKMSKKDTQNVLNLSRRKFEAIYNSLVAKVYKIKELGLKYNVYDMSEDEIKSRCKLMNKSDEYVKFCILAFVKKLKKKEIADIMCLDIETVRKYKSIRRKELER